MLVVETVVRIRREHSGGKPIKAIARDLRLSRKVVRKAIRAPEGAFDYHRSVQPLPRIGPFQERLDALLTKNEARLRRVRGHGAAGFGCSKSCPPDGRQLAMSETARLLATPAGIALCPVETVADGAARNSVIQMKAGRFHGFVVRRGDAVRGYVDRCPHAGLPLARTLDDYLTDDGRFVVCGWHGALFDGDSGTCVGGPCVGQSLTPWPVAVVGGQIQTI